MRKKNTTLAILLGFLVGTGGSAFADATNLLSAADATAAWVANEYRVTLGDSATMNIRHEGAAVYQRTWPLAKFDLSTLPPDIIITNASFNFVILAHNFTGAQNFSPLALRNNLGDWEEVDMTAPINDPGAVETLDFFFDWDKTTHIPFTGTNTIVTGAAGWLIYSSQGVLDLVRGWYDGSITNLGVSIEAVGDYTDTLRYFLLNTKEKGWGTPYIAIEYMSAPSNAPQTQVLGTSDDSWVNGNQADWETNYGSNTTMVVRHENDSWGKNNSLAKFNVSPFSGKIIQVNRARMRFNTELLLWPGPTNFAQVAIFKNTADWNETTVNAVGMPTFDPVAVETMDHFSSQFGGDDTYFTGTNAVSTGGWLEYSSSNLATLVEGWINGTIPNQGVTISGVGDYVDAYRLLALSTKENANVGARPQLVVEYEVVGFAGYAGWAASWGIDIGTEADDPDGDGLNNLYEFGLDGDPTNALDQGTAPTYAMEDNGGNQQFSYVHPQRANAASGLSYSLELTSDLVAGMWTNSGYTVAGTNVTGGTLNFVSNLTDTAVDQKFIRLIIK